jgi:C-terminal binding protein
MPADKPMTTSGSRPRGKVVVCDFITEPLDTERRILGDVADVVALEAKSENELAGKVEDADAIMLYHIARIGAATIQRLQRCRLIVRCGVGFDNVDLEAASAKGIYVANIPDYGTEDVADTALAMALSLARGIHFQNSRLQRGEGPWSYTQVQPLHRLRGRVFGVIGIGRIGTAAALRAKAFGFEVIFYDPYVPQGADKALGIRRVETLEELLGQAHIVSLHCPLNQETRHIINRQSLRHMMPGSYLVNTARGAVVDGHAVVEALAGGHLAGAALDVLEGEPPSPDDPLIRAWRNPNHPAHDRLIVNPHAAFYSEEGLLDMRVKGSRNCRRVLIGEKPFNLIAGGDQRLLS